MATSNMDDTGTTVPRDSVDSTSVGPAVVDTTSSVATLQDWALVLASQQISSAQRRTAHGWQLLVSQADAARAREALASYESENVSEPLPSETPEESSGVSIGTGFATVMVLLAAYAVTGPARLGSTWVSAGSASSEAIRAGEIWRVVTALTLHADLSHIFANALSGLLFVALVSGRVGSGVGLLLVVTSGALGNLVNAYVQGGGHVAVGASTAIFGAVGILSGLRAGDTGLQSIGSSRFWLPVLAGVALLVLMGTSEFTDVLAHLFGFLAGTVVGIAAHVLGVTDAGRPTQWAAGIAAVATVALSWYTAYGRIS